MLGHGAGYLERAEEVNLELMLKLFVGDILCWCHGTCSSIVDKDIDASEAVHHLFYDVLDHLRVGYVAADGHHLHSEVSAQFFCHLVELLHTSCNGHDVAPLVGQSLCHLYTQATRTSRDDGHITC